MYEAIVTPVYPLEKASLDYAAQIIPAPHILQAQLLEKDANTFSLNIIVNEHVYD